MEKGNKGLYVWTAVGVIVAAIVIYFAITGGVLPQQPIEGVQTPQGTVVAPGASPISKDGLVVTPEGNAVNNAAEPGTPTAPKESNPLSDVTQIPSQAVKLTMSSTGITPSSFTVKGGQVVQLSIQEGDSQSHVFKFDDPSLAAVAVGIGPGDPIRVISFNAPSTPGTYSFYCDVPGHKTRGEVGQMIVQ